MQADRTKLVLISRNTTGEIVDSKPRQPRVWITGPHFGRDVFSSTTDRQEASRFALHEAEALLAFGKWRRNDPKIEDADNPLWNDDELSEADRENLSL